MGQVIIFGSLNMDMCVRCDRMPLAGETVEGRDFLLNPGGKGGNQAVAASRAGAAAKMIACVGQDAFGGLLVEQLKQYGVDCSEVRSSGEEATGTAMIICHEGDNRIILSAGANHVLSAEAVGAALDRTALEGDYFITQYECLEESVLEALRLAKRKRMYTIFNPAPAKRIPEEYYRYIDILVLNQTEAQLLTGVYMGEGDGERDVWKRAVDILHGYGAGQVILTLGAGGSVYSMGDGLCHVPACHVDTVDTTAAGDTYIGAMAAALAEGRGMAESIRFGTAAAALTVTRYGAQQSIPGREEIRKLMEKCCNGAAETDKAEKTDELFGI